MRVRLATVEEVFFIWKKKKEEKFLQTDSLETVRSFLEEECCVIGEEKNVKTGKFEVIGFLMWKINERAWEYLLNKLLYVPLEFDKYLKNREDALTIFMCSGWVEETYRKRGAGLAGKLWVEMSRHICEKYITENKKIAHVMGFSRKTTSSPVIFTLFPHIIPEESGKNTLFELFDILPKKTALKNTQFICFAYTYELNRNYPSYARL